MLARKGLKSVIVVVAVVVAAAAVVVVVVVVSDLSSFPLSSGAWRMHDTTRSRC
jgi:hypothetical protein